MDQLECTADAFLTQVSSHIGELQAHVNMSHPSSEEFSRFVAGVDRAKRHNAELSDVQAMFQQLLAEKRRVLNALRVGRPIPDGLLRRETLVAAKCGSRKHPRLVLDVLVVLPSRGHQGTR